MLGIYTTLLGSRDDVLDLGGEIIVLIGKQVVKQSFQERPFSLDVDQHKLGEVLQYRTFIARSLGQLWLSMCV